MNRCVVLRPRPARWGATLAIALVLPGAGAPMRPPNLGPTRIVPTDYRAPGPMPPLVFVSRLPLPAGTGVPGLGPAQRAAIPGGRLRLRERDGRVRDLLPEGALHDVSDPAVSFDARRIAFAGTPHPDSAWRIYVVGVDGKGLRAVTRADSRGERRTDDLDPCWIGSDELCFASTRFPLVSQYAAVRATNLFTISTRVEDAGAAPVRITSERNGAEEPAFDPSNGAVVFSRWWFNRHRVPAEGRARDSVNVWQAITLSPDGPRLRCGSVSSRRAMMAYQVAFFADGTAIAVCALNLGLWPRPGPLAIQRFTRTGRGGERIAGAVIPDSIVRGYSEALGLASPAACAPAALPDGRVVFSYDPRGRGDFGLWVVRPGSTPVEVFNFPETLELDAAPIVTRAAPRTRVHLPTYPEPLPAALPALGARAATFDYRSFDLFRDGSSAPGAAPRASGTRIRFLAAPLVESGAARDTVLLVRELLVPEDGQVDARGLPADVPLFEQLVDSTGRVLMAAHGPTHVAGFNAGAPGGTSRCVGCHLGHSALPVPRAAGRQAETSVPR